MNLFLFLLLALIICFLLSNVNLWALIIIIIFITNYSILLFISSKSLISFISFLTYISGILILMTYMVIVSSSTMGSMKFWPYFLILGVVYLLFFGVSLVNDLQLFPNFDLLNTDPVQFFFSLISIFLVQCFLYIVTLDIKSLRVIL